MEKLTRVEMRWVISCLARTADMIVEDASALTPLEAELSILMADSYKSVSARFEKALLRHDKRIAIVD